MEKQENFLISVWRPLIRIGASIRPYVAGLRHRWSELGSLAMPVFFFSALFALTPQLIDLYVDLVETSNSARLASGILAAVIMFWVSALILFAVVDRANASTLPRPSLVGSIALSALPNLAFAVGFTFAIQQVLRAKNVPNGRTDENVALIASMSFNLHVLVSIAVLAAIGTALLAWRYTAKKRRSNQTELPMPHWGRWLLAFLLFQSFLCLSCWYGFGVAQAGPAIVGCLILNFFGILICAIEIGRRRKLPFVTFGFIMALLWSALDLNDNHEIRTLEQAGLPDRPTIGDDAARWLHARYDPNGKGRAILVSAEGGGAYAAYHAALALARLEDAAPGFASNVYAISGVSGGSLGASVFVGLLHQRMTGSSCASVSLAKMVDVFFDQDFLSPVLAAALGPDLLQRFLPLRIDEFDRGRALERAFDAAWEATMAKFGCDWANPFQIGLLGLYRNDGEARLPRLVLNTTIVESGARTPISFLDFSRDPAPIHNASTSTLLFRHWSKADFFAKLSMQCKNGVDLPLGVAVGLSARFPIVTPAGLVSCTTERKDAESRPMSSRTVYHFIDGGYYENSGTGSILPLLRAIKYERDSGTLRELKQLDITHLHIRAWSSMPQASASFNEVLSIVRGVLNTRGARGEESVEIADRFGRTVIDGSGNSYQSLEISLTGGNFEFPLGWRLSRLVRNAIASSVGDVSACDAAFMEKFRTSQQKDLSDNNWCTMAEMVRFGRP